MSLCGVLLCSGASRRFGAENKLLAELGGQPLVTHAAAALSAAGCDRLLAVTNDARVAKALTGFEVLPPDVPAPALSDSLRAGIARAAALGAEQALVTLGDMPFVSPRHLQAVVALCSPGQASASSNGARRMPPACFPAALFDALAQLSGDRGAQAILAALPDTALVLAAREDLADIDTREDLAQAARHGARFRGSPPR